MRIKRIVVNTRAVAVVEDEMPLITDPMVAMEIVMRAKFELGAGLLAIEASALAPEFFDPTTEMAENILRQFEEFGVKGAVFGDLSFYGEEERQALAQKVFLAEDREAAIAWLAEK